MDSSASETPKPNAASDLGDRPILATLIDPPLGDERPIIASPVVQGYDRERVYGVTRRFSLATIMMMMAGTSLLLTIANALGAPPTVSGMLVMLCIAVALGQMFLFGGKQPRKASVIVGICLFTGAPMFIGVIAAISDRNPFDFGSRLRLGEMVGFFSTSVIAGPIFGALLGYLAGGLVAGVVLVMDLTESIFARWRKSREPDDDPWPAPNNQLGSNRAAAPHDKAQPSSGN
ncbi:MAG TPA: hypothetical protein VGY55_14925 [Pirellulales bacterium]|jgi:MFS family permease|nr:hypothetical protein [Pirellulales bacterium]